METAYGGDDKGKYDALYDAGPDVPGYEIVLKSQGEVIHGDYSGKGRGVCSDKAEDYAEDYQHGNHADEAQNLGQDYETGGVDAHYLQCVYLLGHSHGAYLRGNVGSHLAGQDEAHDAGGELQKHDFSGGVSSGECRHPWGCDVQFYLDAYHGTYEEGYQQDDADAVYSKGSHFLDILFEEHSPSFGQGHNPSHQAKVFAKFAYAFSKKHIGLFYVCEVTFF